MFDSLSDADSSYDIYIQKGASPDNVIKILTFQCLMHFSTVSIIQKMCNSFSICLKKTQRKYVKNLTQIWNGFHVHKNALVTKRDKM